MFDILIYLFESYFDAGSYPDAEKLALKLSAAGFEEEEINQAVDWLSGLRQLSQATYPAAINQTGSRHYAELELERLSTEALHFISFWEHNKIISAVEREMILDRAIALGGKHLSLDKVKLIALMVLWSQHEELDPLIIEDLMTPSNSVQIH